MIDEKETPVYDLVELQGTATKAIGYYKAPKIFVHHCEDGPAYEDFECKIWLIHNKKHREDGPAVIFSDGLVMWYLDGDHMEFNSWLERMSNTLDDETKLEYVLRYGT